ncbi:major facilitator superfamily domain-containing protein [Powellomyces hirtus]|nr:major facilitator superfamily domain-containing protein [Powellomyces hirtus]
MLPNRIGGATLMINFGLAIGANAYDQAIIKRYCEAHYGLRADTVTPDQLLDCTLPDILAPASDFTSLLMMLLTIPSLVTSLLTGPLSDAYGRKPICLFWLCGLMLDTLCPVLVVKYHVGLWVLALGKTFLGVCGGVSTPIMVIFSSVADVCAPADRTRYLGILHGVSMIGNLSGMLLGGWLVKSTDSFEATFTLSFILGFFTLAYYATVVPETRKITVSAPGTETSNEPLSKRFKAMVAYTLGLMRKVPYLVVVIAVLSGGGAMGFLFIVPFYAAQMFGWKTWENTLYLVDWSAFSAIASMFGLGAVDTAVRRYFDNKKPSPTPECLPANDERTPLIADGPESADSETALKQTTLRNAQVGLVQMRYYTAFSMFHAILFAMANKYWMLYAIVPLETIGNLTGLAARTIILEFAPVEGYGTVNSVYGVILSLGGMAAIKSSSAIYGATSSTAYPNAVFAVLSALGLLAFACTFFVRFDVGLRRADTRV